MLALSIFETSVSNALSNGKIEEEEFKVLQTLYLTNCLISITKWEQKTETNSKKSTGRDKRYKENLGTKNS